MTLAEMQGCSPTLYVDGEPIELKGLGEALGDESGARVQVEWDAVANGYVSEGFLCGYCGETFEGRLEAFQHARKDHGQRPHDANIRELRPLVNSAAIDWTGDDLTVTISTGDPRGAFGFTVRRLNDGTRLLHVPYPGEGMPHETLTELHPGTYKIGV